MMNDVTNISSTWFNLREAPDNRLHINQVTKLIHPANEKSITVSFFNPAAVKVINDKKIIP